MLENWFFCIPARLESTRLPRKPLVDLAGSPLINRVYENLKPLSSLGAEIVVACDSDETAQICEALNIPFLMTRVDHKSGSDRCAEAAQSSHRKFIMNVQGDEPFISRDDLQTLANFIEEEAPDALGTLWYKNTDTKSFTDPNTVKLVLGKNNSALYFSRSPIPYTMDKEQKSSFWFHQHMGVYAYHVDTLNKFCSLPASELEKQERLEQLRALENGMCIHALQAKEFSMGIDTQEDLEKAREIMKQKMG